MKQTLVLAGGVHFIRLGGRTIVHTNLSESTADEWPLDSLPFDRILVTGSRGFVTLDAMRMLAIQGVTLMHLNHNGRLLYTVDPTEPARPADRIAQNQTLLDPEKRLRVAKSIVRAKVKASIEFLRATGHDFRLAQRAGVEPNIRDVPSLMTYEAQVAAAYFASLGVVRSYPHAASRPEAIRNFVYSLLEGECRLAARRVGIDTRIGVLHTPQSYKEAGVYDIEEPYRWAGDLLAMELFRRSSPRDFVDKTWYGVQIRETPRSKIVRLFRDLFTQIEPAFRQDINRMALGFETGGEFALSNVKIVRPALDFVKSRSIGA